MVAGSVFNGSNWDIYLAEYTADDYSPVKETSIDFNAGGMDDEVTSLVRDADGNIYTAGYTWDGADNLTRDVFLVKLDPSFTQINSTQFPSNGGAVALREDTINAIAAGDYIYATGKTNRDGADGDRLLIRTNLDFSGTINDNWDP